MRHRCTQKKGGKTDKERKWTRGFKLQNKTDKINKQIHDGEQIRTEACKNDQNHLKMFSMRLNVILQATG